MHKYLGILPLILLCACTHLEEDGQKLNARVQQDTKTIAGNASQSAMRVADNLRDGIKNIDDHIHAWWFTPFPSKEKKPMPPRYCYRVLQDILCYRDQVAGWEGKLVAYQGNDASPPPKTITKQLPLRANDDGISPISKIQKTKPVFVGIPTEVKESSAKTVDSANGDAAHENLPDSPFSPQL